MIQRTQHLILLAILFIGLTLVVSCGEDDSNGNTNGETGSYTAVISGEDFDPMEVDGTAPIFTDLNFEGSFYIRLSAEDSDENRLLMDLGKDGRPAIGVYDINTSLPMVPDTITITDTAFYHQGTGYQFTIADDQEIEITASQENEVQGSFTIAIELTGGELDAVPATLDVDFTAQQ